MKLPLLIALLLGSLLTSCTAKISSAQPRAKPSKADGPVRLRLEAGELRQVQITTSTVTKRILPVEIVASGQVQSAADRTTEIASPVSGRVERIAVQPGERVVAGQLLAILRSSEVAQIESELLQQILELDAEREQDQVQLTLTRSTFEREKQLLAEKVGVRADFEQARSEYLKAAAVLHSLVRKRHALITTASERLRLLGMGPGEANRVVREQKVDNTVMVRTPRSGIIAARNFNPGELVDGSKPLFVVADLTKVWLIAQVFEKDIASTRIGLPATARVDSYPGKTFSGRLDYIAPGLDPQTRTLAVRATFDNSSGRLKPQMFARLTLLSGSISVLAVPTAAVQKSGETYVAYVEQDHHTYEERRLILGRTFDSQVEVKSGLAPGEKIAVKGSVELHGRAIQLVNQ